MNSDVRTPHVWPKTLLLAGLWKTFLLLGGETGQVDNIAMVHVDFKNGKIATRIKSSRRADTVTADETEGRICRQLRLWPPQVAHRYAHK